MTAPTAFLPPLSSGEAGVTAELTQHLADRLLAQIRARESDWSAVRRDAVGQAFDDGFARLLALHTPFPTAAAEMVQVGNVLAQVAELLSPWEELAGRVMGLLQATNDYSPLTMAIMQQIRTAGELIDFMCAREISALCTELAPEPARSLADFGDLPTAAIHEYQLTRASPEIRQLAAANPDLSLLELGDGTMVAAIGELDSADQVTTIAAGVGSSDPTGWPTQVERARAVATATGGASVLWLGYRAPENLVNGISTAPAAQAGARLREFQQSLADRRPEQQRTVIGYSYGSVVLGWAASATGPGINADTAILLGSPGLGVSRATELNLLGRPGGNGPEPRVIAVTGLQDPVGLLATAFNGVHGVDPTTTGFGAQVWQSDQDHSGYWEDPEFLRQLGTLTVRN